MGNKSFFLLLLSTLLFTVSYVLGDESLNRLQQVLVEYELTAVHPEDEEQGMYMYMYMF